MQNANIISVWEKWFRILTNSFTIVWHSKVNLSLVFLFISMKTCQRYWNAIKISYSIFIYSGLVWLSIWFDIRLTPNWPMAELRCVLYVFSLYFFFCWNTAVLLSLRAVEPQQLWHVVGDFLRESVTNNVRVIIRTNSNPVSEPVFFHYFFKRNSDSLTDSETCLSRSIKSCWVCDLSIFFPFIGWNPHSCVRCIFRRGRWQYCRIFWVQLCQRPERLTTSDRRWQLSWNAGIGISDRSKYIHK